MKLTHALAIVSLLAVAAFAETDQPPFTSPDPGTQGNFEQIYRRVDEFKLTDLRVKVGTFTSSGSTGNQSITGVGFKPRLIILGFGFGDGTAFSVGFGWANSDAQASVVSVYAEDGGAVGSQGTNDTFVIQRSNSTGAAVARASLVSMDSDGFTINNTVASATLMSYVAFE
jgi:hypothetical protein